MSDPAGRRPPRGVRPRRRPVRRVAGADEPAARRHAPHVLVGIGGKEPEPVRPAIPELRTCLDDDTGTAQKAAVVVGQVARVDVAVVRPALPDLIDALGASVDGIRANAVGAVADLAAELPKAGSEHRDALAVRLDDPDATGRATACRAHGQVASPVVAEILRATADEDEELAVRKAAERVLEG